MVRLLILAVVGGLAVAQSGCYEPAHVPPKPTPRKIVRNYAAAEISREFAKEANLKENLQKFLEKLGDARTTAELYAAWAQVYPDHPRVVRRAIAKSIDDFYWPVAPAVDGQVFVDGFRAAAEDLVES